MTTLKTQAVSVSVEPRNKAALQTVAECGIRSVENMDEVMVVAYCRSNQYPLGVPDETLLVATPGHLPL